MIYFTGRCLIYMKHHHAAEIPPDVICFRKLTPAFLLKGTLTAIFLVALNAQLSARPALVRSNPETYSNLREVVAGKVVDDKGLPLPGATVTEKDTKNRVLTDNNGNFSIKVSKEGALLTFSFVGFKSVELAATDRMKVVLQRNDEQLSEVVITGYQQLDKNKFTGASAKLKGDDIRETGTTDIGRALEGKVAGVSIQNVSGTFGSAPKIRIRGATSLTGSNKPLWVVDGIALEDVVNVTNEQLSSGDASTILGSSVAGININDVEDIYVLKDVAATSLYGARAMNGVVVVNTKKGRKGSLQVSYAGNLSSQLRPSYNNFNIMNSADQMSVYSEMYEKGMLNLKDIGNRSNRGIFGKMYDQLQVTDPVTGEFVLENTPDAKNNFLKRYATTNTDWFKLLFRNSLVQDHTLSFSGGSDKTQSYTSVGFRNDNGWTIADRVRLYTINSQNTYSFSDKLTGGIITTASLREQQVPGSESRTANRVLGKQSREFDINPYSYALNTSRAVTAYDELGNLEYFTRNYAPFNVLNELQNNKIKLNALDVKVQGNLSYKINPYFKYEFMAAYRYVKTSQEDLVSENSNRANAYRANANSVIANDNSFLYKDPQDPNLPPEVVMGTGGLYNRTENSLSSYNVRNNLSYIRSFNQHDLNVLFGQEIRGADRQYANNKGYGYQFENGGIPLVDYRVIKQLVERGQQYYGMGNTYDRFASFYANAGYTFDKRINLSAAARYDGSNQMGKSSKARWLPTWSISGSWNIDQEAFMKELNDISYLKLRASYGLSANTGNATNSAVQLFTRNLTRPYSSEIESGILIANLENSDLTYEKQYSANIGIDAGFFGGRLNIIADVYKKNGFDLISSLASSGIGGQVDKIGNYADLKSRGLELSINGEIIKKTDWGWKSGFNFSYNTNTIRNSKNKPDIFRMLVPAGANREGRPVSSLYSLKLFGLESTSGIPLFINEEGEISKNNYLQSIKTDYVEYEGPVDPPFTGGLTNTFNYKQFSLTAQITYQGGNKIRLNSIFQSAYTDMDAMPLEFLNRWVLPGDEKITNVPSILDAVAKYNMGTSVFPYENYNLSSARVASGDFARLKYLALTYTAPKDLAKKIGMNTFSMTLSGSNLWLIYADKRLYGQDPEFFNAGGVAQPLAKQLMLSLKVGF